MRTDRSMGGRREKSGALSVAGLWEGHSWTSFLKCTCFGQPLLIRGAKKEGFYPDVQLPSPLAAHLGAGVNAEHGGHLWSPPCWVATRSPLWSHGLCHHLPPEAITLARVSRRFGQPPKSCLGHGGAGGKVGEPSPKRWLKGTGGLQKAARG